MDRRKRKTRQGIKEAFLSLIKNKPIEKITISELSAMADIGRGTFYTHYQDIYDLKNSIEQELIENLLHIFDETYPKDQDVNFKVFTKKLVTYVFENKEAFKIVFNQESSIDSTLKLKEYFIDRILISENLDTNDVNNRIEVNFSVTGTLGVLYEWINDEIEIGSDELIIIIDSIIERF